MKTGTRSPACPKTATDIGVGIALAAVIAFVAGCANVATLSPDSPFVRHLSNPPWIKEMQFSRSYQSGGFGITNVPLTWTVLTNTIGVQPSGRYFVFNGSSPGIRTVSGVNEQMYWNANEKPRILNVVPVTSNRFGGFGTPIESQRPLIEEMRHLGLRELKPGSFAMHEDGRFTAKTPLGEELEGKILKVSNDRPLALTYKMTNYGAFTYELIINLTYQYASATAPLPETIGHTETTHVTESVPGMELMQQNLARSAMNHTNRILKAEYGLDESVTNGYSPSRFFPDVAQYKVQTRTNGVLYINGVEQPSPFPPNGPLMITNQVNK